jgi:phage-related minor tail protein
LTLDESLAKLQFTMNGLEPDFEELTGAFAGLNEQVPLLAKTSANALDVTRFFIDDFASSLQTAFEASLTNGESFLKVFGNMMKAMIARLLAAAAAAIVLAIALSAIFPSGFALSSGGDLLSGASLAKGIFGKMTGIPMLAEGGIVTGPTLAMVGEGGGPEAVIPLDRLGSFMNGGNVTVTGRIQGSDILLSSERADRQRSRYRGF